MNEFSKRQFIAVVAEHLRHLAHGVEMGEVHGLQICTTAAVGGHEMITNYHDSDGIPRTVRVFVEAE